MTIIPKLKEALPKAAERIPVHIPGFKPRGTWEKMEDKIRYYAEHPEKISKRLKDLELEWDVERAMEARVSTLALLGVGLSILDRRFLVIPGVMAGFLLLQAARGWSPPVPMLRRLGIRTRAEIQAERKSLQALKEAFADLGERLEGVVGKMEELAGDKPLEKIMKMTGAGSKGS
jgi:hypothetical protein